MDFEAKVLEFAKANIYPHTKEADEKGVFPQKSFEAIKKERLTALLVPKEYGGMGLGIVEHTKVIYAFANYCATTALCYMMHNVAINVLNNYASKELKDEILPKVAKGEAMLALAYSESGTGTHFYNPEIEVKDGGSDLILTGKKSFVTSAAYADYYLVDSASHKGSGLDNIVVAKNLAGVSFDQAMWDGLGMRGNASCPMKLDGVKVDKRYLIGEAGSGLEQIFNAVAPFFIIGLAAVYSGVAKHASNSIIDYSQNRKYSDDSALCAIPTVQNHLAEIFTKSTAAYFMTLGAANSVVNQDPAALANVIAARINASEVSVEVCTKAMKVGGGTAYAKRINIERLLRDSFASAVMAPSTDVLSIWLGKAITNQDIL